MRLRTILTCLLALVALLPLSACSSTTPTEARAIAAAKKDHTAYTLPPDKLAKAIAISRFYDKMHFVRGGWEIGSLFLILQLRLAARIRDAANRLSPKPWVQGYAFSFLLLLIFTLLQLPLRIYLHRAAVTFGFSVQHWGSWFGDQGKSFLITYFVGGLFVMIVYYLIRWLPRRWWLALWFPIVACVLFGVYVTPYLIDPLFYKFEPLRQTRPALVEQLERVTANGKGIDIPPERMFLMKASDKTTLLNAYVTGFGSSKRLVIWDTMLAKSTQDEMLLVAGHEMGHYVLGHIVQGMLESFFGLLVTFFVGFHVFRFLLLRSGARWRIASQEDWAAMVVMLLVLSALSFFSEPVVNAISRQAEHDADVFGQEAVHGIVADPQEAGRESFQLIGENSFSEPDPSPFVEFWTDSHPSIPFRAAFAKHYDPWAKGEQPKYFK